MVEHGAQLLGLVTGVTVWQVLSGPQSGAAVKVEGTPVTVGSSSASALRLVDQSISRMHAEVTLVEEGALRRDLGSTNGTFAGGHRVRELFVTAGTELTFGVVRVKLKSLEIRELPPMERWRVRAGGRSAPSIARRIVITPIAFTATPGAPINSYMVMPATSTLARRCSSMPWLSTGSRSWYPRPGRERGGVQLGIRLQHPLPPSQHRRQVGHAGRQ